MVKEKERITQRDAVLLLLKCRPKIAAGMIEGELPGYYRKNLADTITQMVDEDLINKSMNTNEKVICIKYSLTNYGEKALDKRFAKLRSYNSIREKLDNLKYAFGM